MRDLGHPIRELFQTWATRHTAEICLNIFRRDTISRIMRSSPFGLICLLFIALPICACNHSDSPNASTKSLDAEAQATAERFRDLLYRHCPEGWRSSLRGEQGQVFQEIQVNSDDRMVNSDNLDHKFEGYDWFGDVIIGAYITAGHPPSKSGFSYQIYKRGGVWYFNPEKSDEPEVRVDDLRSIAPSCGN